MHRLWKCREDYVTAADACHPPFHAPSPGFAEAAHPGLPWRPARRRPVRHPAAGNTAVTSWPRHGKD
jgi:hypothetical protein